MFDSERSSHEMKLQAAFKEKSCTEQVIDKLNALIEAGKKHRMDLEQALADEKAKTNKMQEKLNQSKSEMEQAGKFIEKLKG